MKNARQQKILELIELYDIDTQDTLIKRLKEVGYNVTQTTISRDIRQLNLVKGVTSMGTYKYVAPAPKKENNVPVLNSAITDSVVKIEAAGNIVVVKTFSGMANAIAKVIGNMLLEREVFDGIDKENIIGDFRINIPYSQYTKTEED
jgi:transcriptional regulator of arginine metabolism